MNVLLRFTIKNMVNFELIEGLNVFTYYSILFSYGIFVLLFYLYNSYILTHYKFKEIKFEAETDLMTGAYNRQTGMKILTSKMKKASVSECDFTIVFIDVNNLKKVNDKYGHNEGDELIKIVSGSIKSSLREHDFVSRLGGDEFLVYLDSCSYDEGNKAWKRIQEKINTSNFTMDKKYPISVSVGLADYRNNQSLNVKELLEKADSEMYKNKRAFKKRTT